MKSIVTKDNKSEIQYPWLGIGEDTGVIVLFTARDTGTVVYKGDTPFNVGDVKDCWVMLGFNEFKGKVTLSND